MEKTDTKQEFISQAESLGYYDHEGDWMKALELVAEHEVRIEYQDYPEG